MKLEDYSQPLSDNINSVNVKRTILFIGYETPIRDELKEYLSNTHQEVIFSDVFEDILKELNSRNIGTVVLNMQRIEDAAILRYINRHFPKTHVLLVPGPNLKEAIPALTGGSYDLLNGPFRLEDLQKHITPH
jgi:DNA-binding NtrC family response regulator